MTSFSFFFFSSRRRHTRCLSDWSSDVCSSDLGGVSHVESFDVKPELNRYAGQTISNTPHRRVLEFEGRDVIAGNPAHGNRHVLMGLNTGYRRYGQSGLMVADWWRHIGECSDDIAVVRSLWTNHNDHG